MVDRMSYANRLRGIAEEIEAECSLPIGEQSTEKLTLRLQELEEIKVEQAREIEEILTVLKERQKETKKETTTNEDTLPPLPNKTIEENGGLGDNAVEI